MRVSGETETAKRCVLSNYTLRLHNNYYNLSLYYHYISSKLYACRIDVWSLAQIQIHRYEYTHTSTCKCSCVLSFALQARLYNGALYLVLMVSFLQQHFITHTSEHGAEVGACVVGSRSWSWGPEPARRRASSVGLFPSITYLFSLYNRSLLSLC